MRKIELAVLLSLLASGCAGIQELARSTFEEPKLTFRAASLDALDLEGATVGFRFDLENPNGVGVQLARLGWAVEAEGTRLASGELPGGLAVPARGTAPVTFPVRVRFRDVPGIASLLTSGKDEIAYRLSGTLGVRTPLGVLDLPVSHSDRLRLPRTPAFAVEGLAVRGVSFSSIGVSVRLRVRNPNAFPLPAGGLDVSLELAGARVARAEATRVQVIPAGASAVVEIPVNVDLGGAGLAASALLTGGDVDVHLTGEADLGGVPLPLDLRARLPARR
jgi:LEA14-like dessication related protein